MKPPNFFAELKRRNVYKVAVAYAVTAWLLIQAASILLPTFEAPSWVMKAFVTMVALGFPAALVLSWAFEITPQGIKLESQVAPNESRTHRTGRQIIGVTIALALVAAGRFAFSFCNRACRRHLTETRMFRPHPSPSCHSRTCRWRRIRVISPTASRRSC